MKNSNQKFELAPTEKALIEKLLAKLSGNQKQAKESTGLNCDKCYKEIAEGEKYFVRESAFARLNFENGEKAETKEDARQTGLLCMNCFNHKKDEEDNPETTSVNEYYRNTEEDDE